MTGNDAKPGRYIWVEVEESLPSENMNRPMHYLINGSEIVKRLVSLSQVETETGKILRSWEFWFPHEVNL